MKCLTVCQPWAWCIFRAGKPVENRTWPTNHRGELLIHAGQSREWLGSARGVLGEMGRSEPPARDLVFGAIVGWVKLIDCVDAETARARYPARALFVEGPWCWVLDDPREFERPIQWKGALGLFDVPDHVVAHAMGRATSAVVHAVEQTLTAPDELFGVGRPVQMGGELPPVVYRERLTTGGLFGGGE